MNILHVMAGSLEGGAARGAYWLHTSLRDLDVDSKLLTDNEITDSYVECYTTSITKYDVTARRVRHILDSLPVKIYPNRAKRIFSTGMLGYDIKKLELYKRADVIHLHWINNGFIDLSILQDIDKPIVWTVRDMWPFTGGCHYAMECTNFKNGCGNCEQLNSSSYLDLSRLVSFRKKLYLPKSIKIVAISNWVKDAASSSSLFNNLDIRMISNCIDSSSFYKIDKIFAKKSLGIDINKKVVLVGSTNLKDFYKGFDKFVAAINSMSNREDIVVCLFGTSLKNIETNIKLPTINLGYLHDNVSLRLAYSAAHLFVAPSLMEAFGKTIVESMSCETPVVCFNATGPKDIVDHKSNGYLAQPFDTDDLAKGIEWVLDAPNYQQLCDNARKKVLTHFDSQIVAKQYIALYKEILAQ